jgi:hypothetical protein
MAQTAAWWTDFVLPDVPLRQWVLSVPFRVRYLTAYNPSLCTEVIGTYLNTLFSWQRLRARRLGIEGAKTGSVTAIQRFGSAVNLNVHYHSLVFDGVWALAEGEQSPLFHQLDEPTDGEIAQVVTAVRRRVMRRLERLGVIDATEQGEYGPDPLRLDEPLLADCYGASILGRIATGPRAGQPVERYGGFEGVPTAEVTSPQCAQIDGFSIHANTEIPAGDRERLERVSRYLVRPALANDRLSLNEEGKVVMRLKTQWSDGTTEVRFTPGELIEKLAALVPTPRANLIRYHGVLASHSSWRAFVVPSPLTEGARLESSGASEGDSRAALLVEESPAESGRKKSGSRSYQWRDLMLRVFLIDVLACSSCGGG